MKVTELFSITNGLKILLFLLLCWMFYLMILRIKETKLLQRSKEMMQTQIRQNANERKRKEEELEMREGVQEKRSFFQSIDAMLLQSGIGKTFPFLTCESYIITCLIFSFLTALMGYFFTHSLFVGAGCLLSVCLLYFLLLYIATGLARKKVENNVVTFVNLLENYSSSSDDIVEIIGQSYLYVEEPLRGVLEEFYFDCRNTGDVQKAFYVLCRSIEHEKLKEIIRHIEICSRHDANYGEVIRDCRQSLIDYTNAKQKVKSLRAGARVEILILLSISAVIVSLFTKMLSTSIFVLFSSTAGLAIIGYCAFILIICMVQLFKFD